MSRRKLVGFLSRPQGERKKEGGRDSLSNRGKHGGVFGAAEEGVRLEQVLEEAVDSAANATVLCVKKKKIHHPPSTFSTHGYNGAAKREGKGGRTL